MDIVWNADQEVAEVTRALSLDSQAWEGWLCLRIAFDTPPPTETLAQIANVLTSYLKGVDGRIYTRRAGDLFVLTQHAKLPILQEAASQITDLLEGTAKPDILIDDLTPDSATLFAVRSYRTPDPKPGHGDTPKTVIPFSETAESTHPAKGPFALPLPRVLLVEDDPVTRWMVRKTLKDSCELAVASSASRAYAMMHEYGPDLVFLDIDLPDGNGRDVLRWILHNDPKASVIMFSSLGSSDSIAETINEGARGFIAKPFLRERLLHYINNR